ncbi:lantibiotic dehydratase [Pseudonocardia charpentierae]|uniref:Lantibiotic dehydratase n=1 Tax=Pseudonocardia charpentierae TaxID=3075545 RepID=A0ABU2NI57_9PSEU|nr:lantibiotic dehydratase [Pseudonocardia sp. DSM 45834]MDT0353143.1 lantibiotic dehydratase [Pseudonocardia sp. DSM 45834]
MTDTAHRTGGSWYEPVDGVVVRAPLLPVERYLAIGGSGADSGGAAPADDPLVRLAVQVASDSLAGELDRNRSGRDGARSTAALLRYLIRSSTRPTPYGMFAGVALGAWGATTDVRIAGGPRPVRARPDMGWLTGVVLDLEDLIRPRLGLVANTCAFERDGRVHLSDRTAGGGANGPDVSVRATGVVRRALAATRTARPYQDLVTHLLDTTPGATIGMVRGLVDELCRQDLLISDLRPPMTGHPIDHVLARLAATSEANHLVAQLDEVVRLTRAVDLAAGGAVSDGAVSDGAVSDGVVSDGATAGRDAVAAFRARLAAVAAETGRLAASVREGAVGRRPDRRSAVADVLQVDSVLPLAAGKVAATVAADAARAADLLCRLHPAPGGPRHLGAYRTAFLQRYGPDRRVPLLELLDPRFGLGPHDASGGAHGQGRGHAGHAGHAGHPGHSVPPEPDRRAAARRAERLWELATRRPVNTTDAAGEAGEVVLTDDDLAALSLWTPDPRSLPVSVELSVFVVAESAEAVDRGEHLVVVGPNLGAHEAGRGLGRFADLLGRSAADLLTEIGEREQRLRAGVPAAELVYLPRHHRSANVVVRGAVRGLEIPVGVSPGVPPDRVVAPDELSVGVRDGRLRVYRDRTGEEIAVTAGHMLNPRAAPDVCRFLHDVSGDGVTGLAPFEWGAANALPVLPRVRHGRIVLRPARWRFGRDQAAEALPVGDAAGFAAALPRWRERWGLPRRVYLASGDNRLLLDLDDRDQADLLRTTLRGRGPELVLQEALPAPEHAWVPGPGGRYVSELVVPMVRRVPDRPPRTASVAMPPAEAAPSVRPTDDDRLRPPGSDWLYLTLTGPVGRQDEIVAGPLRELTDDLVARGHVDGWFFLRYRDPDHHLRLRLHGDPATLRAAVLPVVVSATADLIAAGELQRAGLETYDREVERYGGPATIALAEAVFGADSHAVARLLGTAAAREPRLPLTAASVDALLAALGLDEGQRLSWYSGHAPPPKESAAAHRRHGTRIEELLHGTPGGAVDDGGVDGVDEEVRAILDERTAAVAPSAAELARRHADGSGHLPVTTLARSFVHMTCNRLGLDQGDERILLGLLRRNLHSRRARVR